MRDVSQFWGAMTALITPFKAGKIDEAAFQKLCDGQIKAGTRVLVPAGSTGESATLSHEEHCRVIALSVEVADKRALVMAGAGANATAEAIELTACAARAGADAVLSVTPYYNKPTQEGLYQHFKAVHDSSDIPIFIYNIPSRSVIDLSVETMKRLAALPRIVGVKDATADLVRPLRTRMEIGADFIQLSGEDATAIPFLAQGGVGCISVTANVAPALLARMQTAWRAGEIAAAQAINEQLIGLHEALFCETNPAPVKYAACLLGLASEEVRLPLVPLSSGARLRVQDAMKKAGLLG